MFYEGVGLDKPTIDRLLAEKAEAGAIDALNRIAGALPAAAAGEAG